MFVLLLTEENFTLEFADFFLFYSYTVRQFPFMKVISDFNLHCQPLVVKTTLPELISILYECF